MWPRARSTYGIITAALALLLLAGYAGQQQLWHRPVAEPPRSPQVLLTGQLPVLAGTTVTYSVREAPLHRLPSQVDSNSPAFWNGSELVLFISAEQPVRVSGSSVDVLAAPEHVTCVGCERPGGLWLEAVWRDPASGALYGWYHLEPDDLDCQTAPIIGAAVSHDGGVTWHDQGPVLQNDYPIDCEYENGFFTGGNGDFHVILDAEHSYFYFLFSNYAGPIDEQGIGIARSDFADRGQPGTVFKYHNGAWEEPGLGGQVTPLFPSATGWKGPHVEAFWGPSVHWNDYLRAYVALMNRTEGAHWVQEGVYISLSPNLLDWSEPQKIMDSELWYPQVLGIEPGGTDTRAGKTARIYVGGVSTTVIEFTWPGLRIDG